MQVLVLGEDVLVAEAPVADRTLVRLLADMRQPHVPDQPVLVAELLAAYASQRARAAGELQQVAKESRRKAASHRFRNCHASAG